MSTPAPRADRQPYRCGIEAKIPGSIVNVSSQASLVAGRSRGYYAPGRTGRHHPRAMRRMGRFEFASSGASTPHRLRPWQMAWSAPASATRHWRQALGRFAGRGGSGPAGVVPAERLPPSMIGGVSRRSTAATPAASRSPACRRSTLSAVWQVFSRSEARRTLPVTRRGPR